MLQAPWDADLWSLLSNAPEEITPAIINENLFNRKRFRMRTSRVVPADDPEHLVPPSGEWSGQYQDMPCVANQEHEVTYKITFKANGEVKGCLSCKDGDFQIQGVYDMSTGIVAWSQVPVNPRAKATEFYGDVYNLSSGPSRITGTFLTSTGRYCMLNLSDPSPGVLSTELQESVQPEIKRERAASLATDSLDTKPEEFGRRHSAPDALPTLLTASLQPKTEEKSIGLQPILTAKPFFYKGQKIMSNVGSNGGLFLA